MRGIAALLLVLFMASSSLAAISAKNIPAKKAGKVIVAPEKVTVVPAVTANAPVVSSSSSTISIKGGYAGGGGKLAVVMDKTVRDNIKIAGELGYGLGNQYNFALAQVSGIFTFRPGMFWGLQAGYSAYSSAVTLSLPTTNITQTTGIGFGAFIGMNRDKAYTQLGYDTRLGALLELGYIVRM